MELEANFTEVVVSRCLSLRELTRRPADAIDVVARDGVTVGISRNGRLAALIVPIPERVVLEFHERPTAASRATSRAPAPSEPVVDLETIELTDLERELLIDAASTPTGFWRAPGGESWAVHLKVASALFQLVLKELLDLRGGGSYRITKEGRAVARSLVEAGHRGYEETHPNGYHPDVGPGEEEVA